MRLRHLMPAPRLLASLAFSALGVIAGCSDSAPAGQEQAGPRLVINEVVANNEGVWVDEFGETDDYVELYNASATAQTLSDFSLMDESGVHRLPELAVLPGQAQLLWADGTPGQGIRHLPFKISSGGEKLQLIANVDGRVVDHVEVPALAAHHAYLRVPDGAGPFQDCGWATPARLNGGRCGPPTPAPIGSSLEFAPFTWPSPWPQPPTPLALTRAGLRPASFVEVLNTTDREISLSDYALRLARHGVGQPWPAADTGVSIPWNQDNLGPHQHLRVPVGESDVQGLASDPEFEGVLTVWAGSEARAVDRVDFMSWPDDAILARISEPSGRYRFCRASTDPADASCEEVPQRTLGERARRLLTPSDHHALAAGGSALGVESVEFIIDLANQNVVTLLNSADWDLHYTFIRERIQNLPHLDRCDPVQRIEQEQGWYAFSEEEYFKVEGRHYLLGTLVRHAGSNLRTVEFAVGDVISAEQMKQAFFTVMQNVQDPENWAIRPQSPDQLERIRAVEGQVPIVAPDAPFLDLSFQPLSPGVSFGTLRVIDAGELGTAELGPRDIVLTDQVPNDIPLIAGLITESFQTPLAHVNVLCRGRGTPNMALRAARSDPRIVPLIGKLVRLEVLGADFSLTQAAPEEALAYWQTQKPSGAPQSPRLDLDRSGIQPLEDNSISDIAAIGGKAAQLAELGKVVFCTRTAKVPDRAFAIPLSYSLAHFEASGARALLASLGSDPAFLADPETRAAGLVRVRELIQRQPLDPDLHQQILAGIAERWPSQPLRFRSSSNVEDLAGFNGAGLYLSVGVESKDLPDAVDDAVRTVWASLWNDRAYSERDYYNIDQNQVAMGVLVHPAFHSERVNGVAISRDVFDPSASNRFYINSQIGEALVTNPAPGVLSDEFTYSTYLLPRRIFHEHSTFSPDKPVMSDDESDALACDLDAIHRHFRPLLDPDRSNAWFAMDVEFKLVGAEHALLFKQARPYSFGRQIPTVGCDL